MFKTIYSSVKHFVAHSVVLKDDLDLMRADVESFLIC
jgi:hypothetical protein